MTDPQPSSAPKPMPYSPPTDPSVPALYAWPYSAVAGDVVALHGRGPAGPARIEIARVGARRDVVHTVSTAVAPQEIPPDADAWIGTLMKRVLVGTWIAAVEGRAVGLDQLFAATYLASYRLDLDFLSQ